MLNSLFSSLAQFVIAVISSSGYSGIALLMAIESACIPLPSEVIMPFSGYLVSRGRFNLGLVSLAGAIGCVIGSAVAYAVGRYGGREFILKYGKFVLISRKDVERSDRWFARYGQAVVFFSRLLPVIRTFISLPAGVARMPFGRFLVLTFLGSYPWCYALAWGGRKLGENWTALGGWFHKFDIAIAATGAITLVFLIVRHVRHLREENHTA